MIEMINRKIDQIIIVIGLVFICCYYLILNANDLAEFKENEAKIKLYRNKSEPPKLVQIIGDDENVTSNVTIVTMLFQTSKSKHSIDEYKKWSSTMLKSLSAPFVAYIDEYWSHMFIQECRERNLNGLVYIVPNIWHILIDLELERKRTYVESYIHNQVKIDREKGTHSPELYAMWNLKVYITNKTAHLNPFRSNFFIYTDCGAWRGKVLHNWPDSNFISNLQPKLNDRILFGQINEPDSEHISIYKDLMQATFFAGSIRAIRDYAHEFYAIHDEWLDKNLFVGKDQNILNSLTYLQSAYLIMRLNTRPVNCPILFDPWFFYQYYFANDDDFNCFIDKFSLLLD